MQPVLSIIWAALFLAEKLTVPTMIGGTAVILYAGIAVRIPLDRNALLTSAGDPPG